MRWLLLSLVAAQPLGEDLQENLRLTQYRLQHRRTISGKLCAAAFVHNQQRFTDCIDDLAPDGVTMGKPWCYVEAQFRVEGEPPEWGVCRPVIDYDAVSELAASNLKITLAETNKLKDKLSGDMQKLSNLESRYKEACERKLAEVTYGVERLQELTDHVLHSLENANHGEKNIALLEANTESVRRSSKAEMLRSLSNPHNCQGIQGYDDDSIADGISTTFYNSIDFTDKVYGGKSKATRLDLNVHGMWRNREPEIGINKKEFAVRYDGYLAIPASGNYQFSLNSSCGSRLWINKQLVIADRMPTGEYVTNGNGTPVPILSPSPYIKNRVATSPSLYFAGSERVAIRVEAIHSRRLLWENELDAFVKLSWSSDAIPEEVIPADYFFQSNKRPSLRVSYLPRTFTELGYAVRGVNPFIDRDDVFIGDLPSFLEGSRIIRTLFTIPERSALTLTINVPGELYVAYPEDNPLGSPGNTGTSFVEDENERLGLYYAAKADDVATHVEYYRLSKVSVNPNVLLTFPITDGPFIGFIMGMAGSHESCTGETRVLSDPTDPTGNFRSCSASNTLSSEFACEYSLNSDRSDEMYAVWKTSSAGLGAYLEVEFKSPVRLSSFEFSPLSEPLLWPSEITLHFKGENETQEISSQSFSLVFSSNTNLLVYNISPEVVKSVKAEITGMYAPEQPTGGSFKFFGTVCAEEMASTDPVVLIPVLEINGCDKTLADISAVAPLVSGVTYDLRCGSSCDISDTTDHALVWGTNIYTADSALCLSGVHAGVCNEGEACSMSIKILSGQRVHKGSLKHGVTSYSHAHSDISYVALPAEGKPTEKPVETTNQDHKDRLIVVFNAPQSAGSNLIFNSGEVLGMDSPISLYGNGWERAPAGVTCPDLKTSVTDTVQSSILRGGFSFPPMKDTPLCNGECTHNSWSIRLKPNRSYSFVAQLGNACQPAEGEYVYNLEINSQRLAKNVRLASGETFFGIAKHVPTNASGIVTLTSSCDDGNPDCEHMLTTIQQIKITED